MSRHSLLTKTATGKPVSVVMGWDGRLSLYFLTVQDLAAEHEDDEYLYHNLDDIHTIQTGQDFVYFERKLAELGIKIPKQMADEIKLDCENNVGNRVVTHQPD